MLPTMCEGVRSQDPAAQLEAKEVESAKSDAEASLRAKSEALDKSSLVLQERDAAVMRLGETLAAERAAAKLATQRSEEAANEAARLRGELDEARQLYITKLEPPPVPNLEPILTAEFEKR